VAWIFPGVGCRFTFYQKLPLKFLNWAGIKNHSVNFFSTWPSIRLIHIQRHAGVPNKLKYFKASNFQQQLRKVLRWFSFKLFVVFIIILFCIESPCYCTFLLIMKSKNVPLFSGDFPKHAEISRASTTIIIKCVYGFQLAHTACPQKEKMWNILYC